MRSSGSQACAVLWSEKKEGFLAARNDGGLCWFLIFGEGAGMWRTYGAPIAFALGFPALTGWAKFMARRWR
jgi:hypothetical protein